MWKERRSFAHLKIVGANTPCEYMLFTISNKVENEDVYAFRHTLEVFKYLEGNGSLSDYQPTLRERFVVMLLTNMKP